MSSHLGTWTRGMEHGAEGDSMRLDLWDTYRRDEHGKSVLRYCLALITDDERRPVTLFEGEDFCCSPLHAIDSDDTAGALLGFFAHYGETIRYARGDASALDEDLPSFTPRQRDALERFGEELGLWSMELEGALVDG